MNKYLFTTNYKTKEHICHYPKPKFTLQQDDYSKVSSGKNFNVVIKGSEVLIFNNDSKMHGKLMTNGKFEKKSDNHPLGLDASDKKLVRWYYLDRTWAGGRFVIYEDMAELTIYGSGVPIISSYLGKLIKQLN